MRNISCFAALIAAAIGLAGPAAAQEEESYFADLSGANEAPGPGDADGTGIATLEWHAENEQFCYVLAVENIGTATAAHVHRGAVGEAGPPVLTLDAPGADGGSDGCLDATAALRREIRENPAGFYFNVHNADHPAGAIRGQLER
ncbi:CHRD domain-containing protein [Parasphingopyxis marina]|uniref:CHRD domain-containing protein n=1 Tax=Parasphingopyxis marina TaxID=2761622 RepID=A0A842HVU7_9SPHN|nr:CHRD domain-containing protein [Parasphingopyxis marina]MBC2776491.1 CHRD domain-containing protein [Parasphingopyxis marina]